MREHFSCFPFFLDNTWDIPTALRLTIDLVTFSLIPREFETGERSFASGGSRPSDRRGRGGRGSHPDPEIKGGGGARLQIQLSLLSPRHKGCDSSLVSGSEVGRFYSQAKRSSRVLFR